MAHNPITHSKRTANRAFPLPASGDVRIQAKKSTSKVSKHVHQYSKIRVYVNTCQTYEADMILM